MGETSSSGKTKPAGKARDAKLKAALKANLQKRKAQARARTDGDKDNKAG
jgi:hypothetical protein